MTIKELRLQTGMTQVEFAKHLKIPIDTLRNWEQGRKGYTVYLRDLIEYYLRNEKLI